MRPYKGQPAPTTGYHANKNTGTKPGEPRGVGNGACKQPTPKIKLSSYK